MFASSCILTAVFQCDDIQEKPCPCLAEYGRKKQASRQQERKMRHHFIGEKYIFTWLSGLRFAVEDFSCGAG